MVLMITELYENLLMVIEASVAEWLRLMITALFENLLMVIEASVAEWLRSLRLLTFDHKSNTTDVSLCQDRNFHLLKTHSRV